MLLVAGCRLLRNNRNLFVLKVFELLCFEIYMRRWYGEFLRVQEENGGLSYFKTQGYSIQNNTVDRAEQHSPTAPLIQKPVTSKYYKYNWSS